MIEALVLGTIQGIAEWLPISSDGMIVLAKQYLFSSHEGVADLLKFALLLHAGTLVAAIAYFRTDVAEILRGIVWWKRADVEARSLIKFLFLSTLITGAIGLFFLLLLEKMTIGETPGRILTAMTGMALLVTAYFQWKAKRHGAGKREVRDLNMRDALTLGIAQGFTVLPGLSRSGTTVSLLLLRGIADTTALRVSFLMSIPIVLAANIAVNYQYFLDLTPEIFAGIVAALVWGFLTIGWLMKIAQKVNFTKFVVLFGILALLAAIL